MRKSPRETIERRNIIAYLYFSEKNTREISEETEIPLRTVQAHVKYIKEHIREFR